MNFELVYKQIELGRMATCN